MSYENKKMQTERKIIKMKRLSYDIKSVFYNAKS